MKTFEIIDCIRNNKICTIRAKHGKSALRKFLANHCMNTGFYEIHKRLNVWIMSSSFGSYFVAKEIKQ